MSRVRFWLPLILLFGCFALGYLALQQRFALSRAVLAETTRDGLSRSRLADLQRQVAAAEAARGRAKPTAGGPLAVAPSEAGVRVIHLSDIFKDHPEYAAMKARDRRRIVLRTNGLGLAGLNLPPGQLAKLKDLLVERTFSVDDAQAAAKEAGLRYGTPAWRAAVKQAADGVNGEIDALLGADSQDIQKRLQQLSSARTSIQFSYAPDLADAGLPLSAEQNRGLQQAVAESSGRVDFLSPAQQTDYYRPDPVTGLSLANEQLLVAAAPALSPEQGETIRRNMIRQNQQTAILRQYMPAGGGVSVVP